MGHLVSGPLVSGLTIPLLPPLKKLTGEGGQGVLFGQPLPVSIQRCRKPPWEKVPVSSYEQGLLAPDQLLMSESSVRARLLMSFGSFFGPNIISVRPSASQKFDGVRCHGECFSGRRR